MNATPSSTLEVRPPTAARGSRWGRWAARAALLAACVGSIATSEMMSGPFESAVWEGAPVSLSAQAPTAVRPLKFRVSGKNLPALSSPHVTFGLTATWSPTNPDETANPSLRTAFHQEGKQEGPQQTLTFDGPGAKLTRQYELYDLDSNCSSNGDCEWLVKMDLEVPADIAPGTVDVQWTAQGHVYVDGDEPRNLQVTLEAP
jgi:hypothetical protein